MIYNQEEFDIRLEWGIQGMRELAPVSDVVIIVDILSFSTCVEIATANGSVIYPYHWKNENAVEFAKSKNAELADFNRKSTGGYSLSPASLINIKPGTKLVLPSPNGSAITLSSGRAPVICGSLRNAEAAAMFAMTTGNKISIIPAGERWADKTLRPAFEDLIGAGAIISFLSGSLSPESKTALSVYLNLKDSFTDEIKKCSSGKELIERGFEEDIDLACEMNVSKNVPVYREDAFVY
jgi:2-phosphosulfolactate phosphatase